MEAASPLKNHWYVSKLKHHKAGFICQDLPFVRDCMYQEVYFSVSGKPDLIGGCQPSKLGISPCQFSWEYHGKISRSEGCLVVSIPPDGHVLHGENIYIYIYLPLKGPQHAGWSLDLDGLIVMSRKRLEWSRSSSFQFDCKDSLCFYITRFPYLQLHCPNHLNQAHTSSSVVLVS